MSTTNGAVTIRVFCTFALRSIIGELAEPFGRATGHAIDFQFDATPHVRARVASGEPADVILIAREIAEQLAAGGHLAASDIFDVARSGIGVAVRAGTSKPDIGSVEAFKRAMLAARSVVYTDPASGGASGVHFARVLDRLGIADAMRPKSILNVGSYNSELVVRGDAEIAIQQIAEILPVEGVVLVGPLPGELQLISTFVAAVGGNAPQRAAALELVAYLRSAYAGRVIRNHGMDPMGTTSA